MLPDKITNPRAVENCTAIDSLEVHQIGLGILCTLIKDLCPDPRHWPILFPDLKVELPQLIRLCQNLSQSKCFFENFHQKCGVNLGEKAVSAVKANLTDRKLSNVAIADFTCCSLSLQHCSLVGIYMLGDWINDCLWLCLNTPLQLSLHLFKIRCLSLCPRMKEHLSIGQPRLRLELKHSSDQALEFRSESVWVSLLFLLLLPECVKLKIHNTSVFLIILASMIERHSITHEQEQDHSDGKVVDWFTSIRLSFSSQYHFWSHIASGRPTEIIHPSSLIG